MEYNCSTTDDEYHSSSYFRDSHSYSQSTKEEESRSSHSFDRSSLEDEELSCYRELHWCNPMKVNLKNNHNNHKNNHIVQYGPTGGYNCNNVKRCEQDKCCRGPPGYNGQKGCRGDQGIEGPEGPIGCRGPKGEQGMRGCKGDIGPTGPCGGPTGARGPKGCPGHKGDKGDQGPIGMQGPRGCFGPHGPEGPTGYTGPTGPKGCFGPRGYTGPQGCDGERGMQGPKGCKGNSGPTGCRGPTGPAGECGPEGCDGPTGCRGPTGPRGCDGSQGPTGPCGGIVSNVFNYVLTNDLVLCPGGLYANINFGTDVISNNNYHRGIFTAPVNGTYTFTSTIQFTFDSADAPLTNIKLHLLKNGIKATSVFRTLMTMPCLGIIYESYTIHYTLQMKCDDTVQIELENNHSKPVTLKSCNSHFEGFRIK